MTKRSDLPDPAPVRNRIDPCPVLAARSGFRARLAVARVAVVLSAVALWASGLPGATDDVRAQPIGDAPAPGLRPVEPAAIGAALAAVPLPARVAADDGATADSAPAPAVDPAGAANPVPLAAVDETTVIDTFERADWPAGSTGDSRWLPQTLLDLRQPTGGRRWASTTCQAAEGARALCPICGGPAGAGYRCGDDYPPNTSPSVLLRLDLSRRQNMERLDLVMDIWADAAPDEGVFVNYVEYDPAGDVAQRRPIYSATGRLSAWARGQRLNLLAVRDALDPNWRASLAGRVVHLELLFHSRAATPPGDGIFVDNLRLVSRAATVPVTPVPTPSVGSVYCPAGTTCGSLQVEAFIDYRCDGNYQQGVDRKLGRQWVEVLAGATPLGAFTKPSGSTFFRLPIDQPMTATFTLPAGHKMCANSPNPLTLTASDFGRSQRKKIRFRVVPQR